MLIRNEKSFQGSLRCPHYFHEGSTSLFDNITRRYGHKSYPVDALQWAALTTEAKTNVGRCVAYPNAIILEDTNSPVRRLPKMRGSSD